MKPIVLLLTLTLTMPLFAGEKPATQPSQMDQAMAMWQEYATPGPQHAKLASMEGTFDTVSKVWPQPGAPPQVAKGVSVNKMILGGRFLMQDFKGEAMGQPFEGHGFSGFDNQKQKWVAVWADSMGTLVLHAEGSPDPAGKTITTTGKSYDVFAKRDVAYRDVIAIKNKDEHTFDMYMEGPDGKEYHFMNIVYKRRK